ncbi:RES domain-containing protein [Halobacillus naozhouensis]|uniref:RES domain-containing protein n=1 Tax=Halobacillus naozhouensis TaxID=554880 RepID=A0ABY8J0C5_9BACI|nr:RES domain-containing protein [Halobacillus naozhouensis]WFT75945.1 RES domain-containing protein [Halobacillus naozhouensis]
MEDVNFFCLRCGKANEIMDFFENENIELWELDNIPIRIIGFKEYGKYICDLCDSDFEIEEYFADSIADYEQFIDICAETIGEFLSTKVEKCNKCSDGEIIESFHWAMNKEDGTDNYTGTTFYDFIGDYGISDFSLKETILQYIQCSSCGYGADFDKDDFRIFDINDKVLSEHEISEFFGDEYGLDFTQLNSISNNYGIELSKSEVEDFINKISENPMLAYQYETGVKLYNLFKKIFYNDKVFILESGTKIFRGRNRKKDEDKLSNTQLWSPPIGNAGHGRYNLIGIPVLYCSNITEGIPYELNPLNNDYIDIGTFQINTPLKLLDISEMFNEEFGEYISSVNNESKKLKRGYLLTNFIKDCCASIGFNGIRYMGVGKENYYNYALFNYEQDREIKVLDDVMTFDCIISYSIRKAKV